MGLFDDLFARKKTSTVNKGELIADSFGEDSLDESSAKKPFSFTEAREALASLDPANVGEWPMVVKVLSAIGVAMAVGAVSFAIFINNVITQISSARLEEETLLKAYKEADSKQRTFTQHKENMIVMEASYNEEIKKLPKEISVPDIVEEVNGAGLHSGIRFESILVKPREELGTTIVLPIEIIAVGDYHGFGAFVGELSNLQRIITLHDYTVSLDSAGSDATKKQGLPKLKFKLNAKTYFHNEKAGLNGKDPSKQKTEASE